MASEQQVRCDGLVRGQARITQGTSCTLQIEGEGAACHLVRRRIDSESVHSRGSVAVSITCAGSSRTIMTNEKSPP